MFYLLLIVNAIYIALELFFNISLLDVASSSSNFDDIHHLELLGRALSSFGFTFIFWKIISLQKKISIKKKTLLIILVSAITYPLFYYGQMILVNHFSNSASVELKKDSYALVLIKDGIRNGNLNLGIKAYSSETIQSPESKTFSVLSGIILLHNDTSLNFIQSNLAQLSYNIFRSKAREEASNNYEKIKISITSETDYLWDSYSSAKLKISNQYSNSSSLMSKNYTKINADVKLLWSNYSRWNERYSRVLHDYYGDTLEGDLKQIPRCKDQACFNNIIQHNRMTTQNRLSGVSKKSSTFRMNSDISLARQFSKENVYSIEKICQIKDTNYKAIYQVRDSTGNKNYTFNLNGNFIKGLVCVIDHDEMRNDYINTNKNAILGNMHTLNFNHRNINSFLNDPMIQEFMDNQSLAKGGMPLPKPFPVNNISLFNNKLVSDKQKIVNKILSEEIKKKMNLNISDNLESRAQLKKNPEYNERLKNKLGVLYFDGLSEDISEKEFNSGFIKNVTDRTVREFLENYKNSDKYNENGNPQVKAIIVPPIALSLSLFFTLINGGILIVSILKIFIKNEYLYNKIRIFMIFLILTLIVSPILHDNSFSKDDAYNTMLNKLKNENIVLGYCADWTMKTEPMIISMIEKLKLNKITDTK